METVSDKEWQEHREYMRAWAKKKMNRLEWKLKKYAKIYYGESVVIVYARQGAKIITHDKEDME